MSDVYLEMRKVFGICETKHRGWVGHTIEGRYSPSIENQQRWAINVRRK